ncbi:hypothetical protein DFJ58DRAFT_913202 [Suillus subalutaceus]|uniref:uncharacterized protein n=1 Tax=Suillus subalutaceus TaxID=48586 RepID=UPI001B85BB39|nr:uncharacterized protein DFJ58DRAFT_913202 [Suillus subalutaceus]KAG1858963.1 hypothetical protein DFJ58DRAFT_913202 [Suillus subalutaceus]
MSSLAEINTALAALQAGQATANQRLDTIQQDIQALRDEQEQSQQVFEGLHDEVQNVSRTVEKMDKISVLRMHNLTLSVGAPLTWPQDLKVKLPVGFPATPADLQQMTIPMCDGISTALGLPPFPPHASVEQRCERIIIHLGYLQLIPNINIEP